MSRPKTIDERPPRLSRDLRLLALSDALHRYAVRLQPDVNAAGLLVHRAFAAAFARPMRSSGSEENGAMEAGLRDHVDRNLANDAKVSSKSAGPHDRP